MLEPTQLLQVIYLCCLRKYGLTFKFSETTNEKDISLYYVGIL